MLPQQRYDTGIFRDEPGSFLNTCNIAITGFPDTVKIGAQRGSLAKELFCDKGLDTLVVFFVAVFRRLFKSASETRGVIYHALYKGAYHPMVKEIINTSRIGFELIYPFNLLQAFLKPP